MSAVFQNDPTPPEHQHTEAVVLAAIWHADQFLLPQPIILVLCQRFGLTTLEATEACALAERYRIYRRAHG